MLCTCVCVCVHAYMHAYVCVLRNARTHIMGG